MKGIIGSNKRVAIFLALLFLPHIQIMQKKKGSIAESAISEAFSSVQVLKHVISL
jgi:hypothetical protein